MFICRVIGSVVSTIKHDCYNRRKLLLVKPTDLRGRLATSGTMVAVDATRAGVGDWVLVVSGGGAGSEVLGYENDAPVREVVVGIIDRIDLV